LLKCLLTRRTRRLPRDEAYELFWPRSDPEAAATTLRGTVFAIRRTLEPGGDARRSVIVLDHDTIGLRQDADVWLDADAFERLVAEARRSDTPADLLEQADRLYVGDYLPDDLYDDWATQRRESLRNLWTELQFELSRSREQRGDVAGAILALQRVFEADRCNERAARELMRCSARHGRRTDALRVYERLVDALRDELGAAPSPETVAVQRQVADGDPGPSAAPAGPAPADTPRLTRTGPAESPFARSAPGEAAPHPGAAPPAPESARPADVPYEPSYPFPTPGLLVGRQDETLAVEQALARGLGGGQTILIGATAGTGKSALVSLLVRQARSMGFLCLAGGSFDQESPSPYGPVRDALCDYFLAQPADHLRAELGELLLDLEAIVPELRYHLADARDRGETAPDPSRLQAAVHGCLRALARRAPTLLCLDDLHAADGATLEMLHYLARQTRRLRITLVGTYRTEEVAANRTLSRLLTGLRRERLCQEIVLRPLEREETLTLTASLLDGPVGERLADALYTVTEGNPLFVEQLVLALLEDRRIHRSRGVWEQVADDDLPVPPLVQDVIEQRFERLPMPGREILSMAAVLGQTFDLQTLSAALPGDAPAVAIRVLDEAIRAQLVRETASGYRFGHAMIREALYGSLNGLRRAVLHARAGEAIEQVMGERVAERAAELALHFGLASAAAPTIDKTLRYSLEAGRHAARLSAHREALTHFTRACTLLNEQGAGADTPRHVEAVEGQGAAQRDLGLWQAAIRTFQAVLELSDDPLRRARAHGAIGRARQQIGETDAALAAFESGLAEIDRPGDTPETTDIRIGLTSDRAYAHLLQGRFTSALRAGQEILAVAERTDRPRLVSRGHAVSALALMWMGREHDAVRHHTVALQASERDGNKLHLAAAHENFGTQLYLVGRFSEARSNIERAVTYYLEAAGERRTVLACQRLSRIFLAEGDLERAFEHAERGRTLAAEVGDRWAAECDAALGAVHAARAAWQDAAACFERALGVHRRIGHMVGATDSLVGLGLVRERLGQWDEAESWYRQALDVTAEMDPGVRTLAVLRHLGRLLLRKGDRAAGAAIEEALTLAEQMPTTLEASAALLLAAERIMACDLDRATALTERALRGSTTMETWIEGGALLVDLLLAAERVDAAAERVTAILPAAERTGAPIALGWAHLAAGRVAAARRDAASSERSIRAALDLFTAAGSPYERAVALRDLAAAVERSDGSADRAAGLRREAADLLASLGVATEASGLQPALSPTARPG
jgi:DNA-binding SARP family transcriptional activator/Tfp pilus assembly protein PilF